MLGNRGKAGRGHEEEDLPKEVVKTRAVRGVASMFVRHGLVRLLGLIGMLVLARVLTPEMFGIFAIAQFVIVFFEELSSLGLAASLIRKKDKITDIELRTVFTIQQTIAVAGFILILLLAPEISRHYELDASYDWLFRVLGIGLFLASLKTIPTVIMQRQLRHDLVAAAEVVEHIVYLVTAVTLAYLGYGVWSLVMATLLRGITGVSMLLYISRWKPAFGFDSEVAREVLRFGVPLQLASFVHLANNAIIPVVVGSFLGVAAVGFVILARTLLGALASQPLILMGKVQLRVFGMVQDDREKLTSLLNKSMFLGSFLTLMLLAIVVPLVKPIVTIVLTDKWAPATELIGLMSAGYLLFTVTMPALQVLKAVGDSVTPLLAALIRFVLQLGIFMLLFTEEGLLAFAYAFVASVLFTAPVIIWKVRRYVSPRLIGSIAPQLLSAVLTGVLLHRYAGDVDNFFLLVVAAFIGGVVYMLCMSFMRGEMLAAELENILGSIAPRSEGLGAVLRILSKLINAVYYRRLLGRN